MKTILLLAKPLAALAVLATAAIHPAHLAAPDEVGIPNVEHDLDWFASPPGGGRGDPSSSSSEGPTCRSEWSVPSSHSGGGYADLSRWYTRAPAFPRRHHDPRWRRMYLGSAPDDHSSWRPWLRLHLDPNDIPCEQLAEDPASPAHQAPADRREQVLAYQAACLTLPARNERSYGIYARASDYFPVPERKVKGAWSTIPRDVLLHDQDALEREYHQALLMELARTMDSLLATMRTDTTVVMP